MEKIQGYCFICNGGDFSKAADFGIKPFDKYLSQHLFDNHQITDVYRQEKEYKEYLKEISKNFMNNTV